MNSGNAPRLDDTSINDAPDNNRVNFDRLPFEYHCESVSLFDEAVLPEEKRSGNDRTCAGLPTGLFKKLV